MRTCHVVLAVIVYSLGSNRPPWYECDQYCCELFSKSYSWNRLATTQSHCNRRSLSDPVIWFVEICRRRFKSIALVRNATFCLLHTKHASFLCPPVWAHVPVYYIDMRLIGSMRNSTSQYVDESHCGSDASCLFFVINVIVVVVDCIVIAVVHAWLLACVCKLSLRLTMLLMTQTVGTIDYFRLQSW